MPTCLRRTQTVPLSCLEVPALRPLSPTETLHGGPSREGGKKQKSERSCPSDASHLSSFNGMDITIMMRQLYALRDAAAAATTTTLELRLCQT